jgi:hypothetical protein
MGHCEPIIRGAGEIERLPLDRPALAMHARGIELCARIALEGAPDSTRWQSLLERLSRAGVHGSWRRAALLALVRSEIASELLTRAASYLPSNNASGLRELIRTTMAVDAVPAAQFLTGLVVDPSMIPADLNVPSGPSWLRLIRWLLALGLRLPTAAIPDVVDLYTSWSGGMIGLDPVTPRPPADHIAQSALGSRVFLAHLSSVCSRVQHRCAASVPGRLLHGDARGEPGSRCRTRATI